MSPLRRSLVVVALAGMWLALMGEVSVGNVVAGLVVGAVAVAAFPLESVPARHRVHPIAMVSLCIHFIGLLIASNVRMVLTVLGPRPDRLRSGIVRVELTPTTPLVTTLVANAVTLTPGSLTVTAENDGVLHVHMMSFVSSDATRSEVIDIHRRVLAAFEPTGGQL